MKNTLSKWFYPITTPKSLDKVKSVIKSGFINEGVLSNTLSKKIAKICSRKYATSVSSGSTGLVAALLALGIKKNDIVLIPGFTFIATANAVSLIGANIHFVDIDLKSFCICENKLEIELKKLKKKKKKISALITVEVNGRSPNYEKILKLSKKFNFPIITDSAEALGSKYNNKPLGSYGDISVISLSPNKIVTSAQGGIVLTNKKKLINLIEAIKKQGNHVRGDGGSDKFYTKGLNFKLSDVHSAIALGQLNLLKKRLNNLKKINNTFKKLLPKDLFYFPKMIGGGNRLWVDCLVTNKVKAIKFLKKKRIAYREFWIPLNIQKAYSSSNYNLANAHFASKHGLWLSSNFEIKPNHIIENLKKY
tara:strand:+ start:13808 stop:14899 length:1092 start_codon:yes stop_codon:yes gene_type:complete